MDDILEIPYYGLIKKNGLGRLFADYKYETRVVGYSIESEDINLDPDGTALIKLGFEWDFASGPAVDTPVMVAASLVHDALYVLMDLKLLPVTAKLEADKTFRDILKRGGSPFFRRQYCFLAVKLFGRIKK